MLSKSKYSRLLCLSATLLVTDFHATRAGIRPSFALDYSAWHSTVIVLVEVTAEDGVFSVVESWKGELPAAELITVPELTPSRDAKPISFYFTEPGLDQQLPRPLVGSRKLLFLKQEQNAIAPSPAASSKSVERWLPADVFENMKTSALWIDDDELYSFQQLVNPGPTRLSLFGSSLKQVKQRVDEICRIQRQLETTVILKNTEAKAEGLKPYVRSNVQEARRVALKELGKCGRAGLSTIREMLDDREFSDQAADLITALEEAGGEGVAQELDSRLQQELAYWRVSAPSLSPGWWNQDATPHAPLRERYAVTIRLVLGLQRTHYTPALATATELGALWRSFPQLNDPSGLNQMAEECDKLVEHLRAN